MTFLFGGVRWTHRDFATFLVQLARPDQDGPLAPLFEGNLPALSPVQCAAMAGPLRAAIAATWPADHPLRRNGAALADAMDAAAREQRPLRRET